MTIKVFITRKTMQYTYKLRVVFNNDVTENHDEYLKMITIQPT